MIYCYYTAHTLYEFLKKPLIEYCIRHNNIERRNDMSDMMSNSNIAYLIGKDLYNAYDNASVMEVTKDNLCFRSEYKGNDIFLKSTQPHNNGEYIFSKSGVELDKFKSLKELHLYCRYEDVTVLTTIESVMINDYGSFNENFKPTNKTNIHDILEDLSNNTNLQHLSIYTSNPIGLYNIHKMFPKLKTLSINHMALDNKENITNYSHIGELKELETLEIICNKPVIKDLDFLCNLTNLKTLRLKKIRTKTLPDLGNLINLTELSLTNCTIKNFEVLTCLPNLTKLYIDYGQEFHFTGIDKMSKKLEKLTINNCVVTSIKNIGELPNLVYLDLRSNLIKDIAPVTMLPKLQALYIEDNSITNYHCLTDCHSLVIGDFFRHLSKQDYEIMYPKHKLYQS